ncbi:uncharacterized protein LOC123555574 isoform X2 [Mercenaria mercenaria]|uniref:uncharacterized protein LOC123555574 isoform X2 n=1 Tax=Mercenaria mercenaria TaxID=6596 RepID=UPI00234E4E4F|nr:uncharacterized protein LOC123555574 isoform X2 [Mercenaria mercenaria]
MDFKNKMILITSTVVLLVGIISNALGYEIYQREIPNGEMVPHPCKENFLWRGVGHFNEMGGGPRNPFGLDFKANNFRWDSVLCQKDSDGDGKTNGEELGDPECVWTKGKQPTRKTRLTHPGICDPMNTPLCNGKTDFVQCEHKEFDCPAIKEEGTFNFTVRLPETAVPAKETTYMCYTFEVPSNESHVVAYEPIIDNDYVMHHMVVFKCKDDTLIDNTPYACGMSPGRGCSDIVAIWSLGMVGQCLHKDSGVLIGGLKGFKKAAIQFHWNNPEKRADESDSSGFTFYITPKLRPYNSGILTIGQTFLEIPPRQEKYTTIGMCPSECTPTIFADSITVTSVYNHMHYLGRAQMTELRRDGVVTDLGNDTQYSYDYPVLHEFEKGVDVYPGDELRTTCVFKSTSREATTYYGDETNDEMCYSFLSYFPAENVRTSCSSWKNISVCDFEDGTIQGCDLSSLRLDNPETMQIISTVTKKCMPGLCKAECLMYVRDVKKMPCFKGDVDIYTRRDVLTGDPEEATFKYMSSFYAAFDSCDREIMKEQIEEAAEKCSADKALARENCCAENMCEVNSATIFVFDSYILMGVILIFFF